MKKYTWKKMHIFVALFVGNTVLIGLAINESESILKAFLVLGAVINTLIGLSLFFEYFLIETDRLINVKLFGLIRHDIHWDKIGRIFYNVDNKLIKAIKVDYGNFWENSIIFNNSLIDYQDLAVNIYNKAKDNNGFSIDYRVLDDLKKFADSKKI